GWSLGLLWLVDRVNGGLDFEALWHADGVSGAELEEIRRPLVLQLGDGLPGKAWAAGGSVTLDDVGHEGTDRSAELVAEGLRGGLAFPVSHGADVLGVLEFYMHSEHVADEETMV